MGTFDRLFPKKDSGVAASEIVAQWRAARTLGGLQMTGGSLLLTRDTLVFTPIDIEKLSGRRLKLGLVKAAMNPNLAEGALLSMDVVLELVTKGQGLSKLVVLPLSDVASIVPLNQARWYGPPQIRIMMKSGKHLDLGVGAGFAPVWSAKHNIARDDCVRKVQAALDSLASAA
jgi:hypothetical protein